MFCVHFRGAMDNWDPAVTDGLAANREVILFDYAGVAGSEGQVPQAFEDFGDDTASVIRALGIEKADILGLSIGGYVAQEVALRHPDWCAGWCWPARVRGPASSKAGIRGSIRWLRIRR